MAECLEKCQFTIQTGLSWFSIQILLAACCNLLISLFFQILSGIGLTSGNNLYLTKGGAKFLSHPRIFSDWNSGAAGKPWNEALPDAAGSLLHSPLLSILQRTGARPILKPGTVLHSQTEVHFYSKTFPENTFSTESLRFYLLCFQFTQANNSLLWRPWWSTCRSGKDSNSDWLLFYFQIFTNFLKEIWNKWCIIGKLFKRALWIRKENGHGSILGLAMPPLTEKALLLQKLV